MHDSRWSVYCPDAESSEEARTFVAGDAHGAAQLYGRSFYADLIRRGLTPTETITVLVAPLQEVHFTDEGTTEWVVAFTWDAEAVRRG